LPQQTKRNQTMNSIYFIFQDWTANQKNTKGRIILILFRMANLCARKKINYYIGFPYLIFYKIFVEWILSIEIPWNLKVGKNLKLFHGQCLVINKKAIIGENCTLRHCTTIGNKKLRNGSMSRSPTIGNNVDIGSNACIIGDINIGDNVVIGSGAVVVKNIRSNSLAVGNPASEKSI